MFPAFIRDSLLLNIGGGVWGEEHAMRRKFLFSSRHKYDTMSNYKKSAIPSSKNNEKVGLTRKYQNLNHPSLTTFPTQDLKKKKALNLFCNMKTKSIHSFIDATT